MSLVFGVGAAERAGPLSRGHQGCAAFLQRGEALDVAVVDVLQQRESLEGEDELGLPFLGLGQRIDGEPSIVTKLIQFVLALDQRRMKLVAGLVEFRELGF